MTNAFHEERIGPSAGAATCTRGVGAGRTGTARRAAGDGRDRRAGRGRHRFQAALVADLEAALVHEGYEPSRPLLDELRKLYPPD